jgi:hypothetical protein
VVAQHGHVGPDVLAEPRSAGQVRTSFEFAQDRLCPYANKTKTGVGFPPPVDEMTTFRAYLLSSVPVAPNSLRATVRAGRAMGSAPAAAP